MINRRESIVCNGVTIHMWEAAVETEHQHTVQMEHMYTAITHNIVQAFHYLTIIQFQSIHDVNPMITCLTTHLPASNL